jgi:hypothetical protein
MAGNYSKNRNTPFCLRLGEELHEQLKAAAAANSRSMNTEIYHRLEESFEPARAIAPAINSFIEQAVEAEVRTRLKAIAAQIGGA